MTDDVSNSMLHRLCDEWPVLNKFCLQRDGLALVFSSAPGSASNAMNSVQPQRPHVQMRKTDEVRNLVIGTDSQLLLT